MNGLQHLANENIRRLYESIREQVSADMRLGGRYRLMGESAKQRSDQLREEMERRQMQFSPILWPLLTSSRPDELRLNS
jgi:hypothetical protein